MSPLPAVPGLCLVLEDGDFPAPAVSGHLGLNLRSRDSGASQCDLPVLGDHKDVTQLDSVPVTSFQGLDSNRVSGLDPKLLSTGLYYCVYSQLINPEVLF